MKGFLSLILQLYLYCNGDAYIGANCFITSAFDSFCNKFAKLRFILLASAFLRPFFRVIYE